VSRVLGEMWAFVPVLILGFATVLDVELPLKLAVVVLPREMAVPRAMAAIGLVLVWEVERALKVEPPPEPSVAVWPEEMPVPRG